MKARQLLVLFGVSLTAGLVAAGTALAQSAPAGDDSDSVVRQAMEAVASDSAAIDALRNDPEASGQEYNRAAAIYHAAKSLLESGDYSAATDSAGNAEAAAGAAADRSQDAFDRISNGVGAAPMRDSSVDNTERAEPDGVPQRTYRDSEPFGAGAYTPDGVPQRAFADSLPFGTEKAEPVDQP
jgi:hypothetical protein